MKIRLNESLSEEINKIAKVSNKTVQDVLTSSLINGLRCMKESSDDSHLIILNPKTYKNGHLIFKIKK